MSSFLVNQTGVTALRSAACCLLVHCCYTCLLLKGGKSLWSRPQPSKKMAAEPAGPRPGRQAAQKGGNGSAIVERAVGEAQAACVLGLGGGAGRLGGAGPPITGKSKRGAGLDKTLALRREGRGCEERDSEGMGGWERERAAAGFAPGSCARGSGRARGALPVGDLQAVSRARRCRSKERYTHTRAHAEGRCLGGAAGSSWEARRPMRRQIVERAFRSGGYL